MKWEWFKKNEKWILRILVILFIGYVVWGLPWYKNNPILEQQKKDLESLVERKNKRIQSLDSIAKKANHNYDSLIKASNATENYYRRELSKKYDNVRRRPASFDIRDSLLRARGN